MCFNERLSNNNHLIGKLPKVITSHDSFSLPTPADAGHARRQRKDAAAARTAQPEEIPLRRRYDAIRIHMLTYIGGGSVVRKPLIFPKLDR